MRKGETDIGRKNTRVRAVFRVHIPQANGKVLSLQVASIPIECCEWTLLIKAKARDNMELDIGICAVMYYTTVLLNWSEADN